MHELIPFQKRPIPTLSYPFGTTLPRLSAEICSRATPEEFVNIFRESAKRKQKLQQLVDDIAVSDGRHESVTLLALCPTRWYVRHRFITKLLKFWSVVLLALDELVKEAGRGDVKCIMEGLLKQMSKTKTYFTNCCVPDDY